MIKKDYLAIEAAKVVFLLDYVRFSYLLPPLEPRLPLLPLLPELRPPPLELWLPEL